MRCSVVPCGVVCVVGWCVSTRGVQRRETPQAADIESIESNAISTHVMSKPTPPAVTFLKAFSKLKSHSSIVSFHWNVEIETFEL